MKILFSHNIFSLARHGGVARYYYELANNIMHTDGVEVEVFAPLFISEYLEQAHTFNFRGWRVPEGGGAGRYACWGANAILSYLMVQPRHDINIFHETYYSVLNVCPERAKRVVTVYDMIHEKFPLQTPWAKRTLAAKAKAIARADHILCISHSTRRDLLEILDVPEEKTSVVYLGHGMHCRKPKEKPVIAEPYILYVGQRKGYKNFTALLCAYASSKTLTTTYKLLCFGGGRFSEAENSMMPLLGLNASCILHYEGGDDVLSNVYSNASVFVYPSLYEGFGIPPLEAMSFGCPVACSSAGSLPEVVGNAAEFFDPKDDASIRIAIEKILSSPSRAAELIQNGYNRKDAFSWGQCAKETLDAYRRLLNS